MHEQQRIVRTAVVRRLLDDQQPRWRDLPLRPVASGGTVNAVLRLGDDLAVRLPLRGDDVDAVRRDLEAEARAAAELAAASPVPAPEPVVIGRPGVGCPLPWSVQTWVAGHDATVEDPARSTAFAQDLAGVVRALRSVDTGGRGFTGEGRGGHLPDHDEWVAHCLTRSAAHDLDVASLGALWADLRSLPRSGPDVMSHGDLMPGNVLVADGRLVGLLDTGGFAAADPALDLVAAWHLLDPGPRAVLRESLACTDQEWARGRAWALQQALGLVWYYATSNPPLSLIGRRTLDRVRGG